MESQVLKGRKERSWSCVRLDGRVISTPAKGCEEGSLNVDIVRDETVSRRYGVFVVLSGAWQVCVSGRRAWGLERKMPSLFEVRMEADVKARVSERTDMPEGSRLRDLNQGRRKLHTTSR